MTAKLHLGKCFVEVVDAGNRLRSVDPEKVAALAESIAAIGLQQPISIWSPDDDTLDLVAGLHRLEAVKKLFVDTQDSKWEEIDCIFVDMDDLDRQLWQIDENLIRSELSGLERAKHTAKRAEVVRQKQLLANLAKKSAHRPNAGQTKFAKELATQTGHSERTVRRDKARGERIADDVAETICRMPDGDYIANSGAELDALARVSPEVQRQAVHLVKCDEGVDTIRQAIAKLKPPSPTPDINRVIRDLAHGVNKFMAEGDKKLETFQELSGFFGEADFLDVRGLHAALVGLAERVQGFIKSFNLEEHDGHGDVMENHPDVVTIDEGPP